MATMPELIPPLIGPPPRFDSASSRVSRRRLRKAFRACFSSWGEDALGVGTDSDSDKSGSPRKIVGRWITGMFMITDQSAIIIGINELLLSLIKPAPVDLLHIRPVSTTVNSVKNQSPECVAPLQ
jgi:hypothetical protein